MSASTGRRIETAGGVSLCVHERGSGPPLLLLHGFSATARSLDALAQGLAEEYRVIAPDLVGHGASDAPRDLAPYRMDACIAQLCALLDALETGPVGVLGYSMGGRVALALLAQAPERVRSGLLVSASAGIANPATRAERRRSDEALAGRIESQGVPAFVDAWLAQPLFASQQRRLDAAARAQTRQERLSNHAHGLANSLRGMGSGAQPPLHAQLRGITQPVALAVGEEDDKFRRIAGELAREVPRARVHCIPRAGHALHLENPPALLALARRHFAALLTDGPETPEPPRGVGLWWLAARPRTLPLALAPVLVGSAVALHSGGLQAGPAVAAGLGALTLQVGANYANDVFDAERGSDTEARIGPPRAVQMGWVSARGMRAATAIAFATAVLVGLYLVAVAGWPIALTGLLAIAAGIAYTGGPWPLGYHGLGEVTVFLFFGMMAVCGSCFVQTGEVPPQALLASIPVGALAAAVLVVNNLRDVDEDRQSGKRTLAVRWGRRGARAEYTALLGISYASLPALWLQGSSPAVLLALLVLPRALRLQGVVWRHVDGPTLNHALAGSAQLALVFSLLLALGLAVPR